MSSSTNVITIRGALKVESLPELACFTSVADFIKALPNFLSIEIPDSITNVIVSNVQPADSQRTDVWFRTTNSGGFLGIYVFAGGKWNIVTPAPQQVFWMYGISTDVPTGYQLIDHSNPNFTTAHADSIMAQYKSDDGGVTFWYFAATYVGF